MKNYLLLSILLSLLYTGYSQESSCNCCSSFQKQFDFWIGNWNVYDTTGNKIGENEILSTQDHCVIQENWKSPNSTGTSMNYYNVADSSWNQLWVDNQGNPLILKGVLKDGKMVMRSKENADGNYNQITWEANPAGEVVQTWRVLGADGKLLALAFKGIYRRK